MGSLILQKWWIKCLVQRALSHIPSGENINALWSRKALLDEISLEAIRIGILQIRMLLDSGFEIHEKVALEIGSGWKPILPFLFRIAGCKKVILCDLHRHMDQGLLNATIHQIRAHSDLIASMLDTAESRIEEVLPGPGLEHDYSLLIRNSGFEYRAPFDLRETDYASHSIDIVFSRSVLEHIPLQVLEPIMMEMHRILKPEGAMVHTIDLSDHWEHSDKSISRINFLKFPGWWWKIINSPISYQNRLRLPEYLQLLKKCGFELIKVGACVDKKTLADTHKMYISNDFKNFTNDELAILVSHIVAVPI